jgi:hypothetical protein
MRIKNIREFENSTIVRVMRQHHGVPTRFQICRGEDCLRKKIVFYVFFINQDLIIRIVELRGGVEVQWCVGLQYA